MLDRSLSQTFEYFGLRGGEFDVLAALRRVGEPYSLTPRELFRSMKLSSATMINCIDHLEGYGLVRRSPDPDGRRSVLITITDEGLTLVDEPCARTLRTRIGCSKPSIPRSVTC